MIKPHMDIPKNAGAYRIVNAINGKMYIGSTGNLRARHRGHLWSLKHGVHSSKKLQIDYEQYGLDCLEFEVLVICPTREYALPVEQHFINRFKPFLNARGYNTSPTAKTTLGVPCSENKKVKIGVGNTGKKRSLKFKKIASKWTRQRNLNASPELKKKWSLAQKKRMNTPEKKEIARIWGLKNRRIPIATIEEVVKLRDSGVSCKLISEKYQINYTYVFKLIERFKRGDFYVKP